MQGFHTERLALTSLVPRCEPKGEPKVSAHREEHGPYLREGPLRSADAAQMLMSASRA
jgi:hypothetical protein